MPIRIRRRNTFRKQILTAILLSVLAGLIGGGLVGISTERRTPTQSESE